MSYRYFLSGILSLKRLSLCVWCFSVLLRCLRQWVYFYFSWFPHHSDPWIWEFMSFTKARHFSAIYLFKFLSLHSFLLEFLFQLCLAFSHGVLCLLIFGHNLFSLSLCGILNHFIHTFSLIIISLVLFNWFFHLSVVWIFFNSNNSFSLLKFLQLFLKFCSQSACF